MAGLDIVTFGCRLNTLESEIIRKHAAAAGLDDAVIVNTCAVTAEAERQARQTIRRLRRERPEARLIVTGCAAQIDPQRFAAMPEIDQVLGNREKLDPASYLPREDRVVAADIFAVRETAPHLVEGFEGRARAFLQVQEGCDHRCTFCIIPFGRGNSRSLSVASVIAHASALLAHDYRELVLTGVDITSYGEDLAERPSLGTLCRELLAVFPDLERLRLSSLDPVEIDDELWGLIADEPRLMPHLHLSIQSGNDMILKRMKRRHSRADALADCERARRVRPDIALGADLIAGFPTETDAMFESSLSLIHEAALDYVHIFPYSARPGTPASRMPQHPRALVKARAAHLRAAGAERLAASLARRVGTVGSVLIERGAVGHTEHFAPVRVPVGAEVGTVIPLRIISSDGEILTGAAA